MQQVEWAIYPTSQFSIWCLNWMLEQYTEAAWLWKNTVGTAVTFSVGIVISILIPTRQN